MWTSGADIVQIVGKPDKLSQGDNVDIRLTDSLQMTTQQAGSQGDNVDIRLGRRMVGTANLSGLKGIMWTSG